MATAESLEQHQKIVQRIVNEQINSLNLRHNFESHMMRQRNYPAPPAAEKELNHILNIDVQKGEVLVEPRVTQEQLVQALLPLGWIPPVVAEFRKITVGGAIMGGSLESSSHRWGQFNDPLLSYELYLSDRTRINASPEENSELFYGVSSSYGSLARLLAVRMPLVQAKSHVTLQIQTFEELSSFMHRLREVCQKEGRPDYIEGIVFAQNCYKMVTGRLSERDNLPLYTQSSPTAMWYYQKIYNTADTPFQMPLEDYLFRYDRGAFWMGAYALFPSLLFRFWCEDTPFFLPQFAKNRAIYSQLPFPSLPFRALTAPIMPSSTLYKWLHWKKEAWFERHFVVQDFYLPASKTAEFIQFSFDHAGVMPLWICPCKSTTTPQIFAAHQQTEELLFDVGLYGWPRAPLSSREVTRALEMETYRLGGKKMFYSWNYLSPQELRDFYPFAHYEALVLHYRSQFPSFCDKVLPR